MIQDLNRGQPQPALERMRQEFPFLAEATEAYALGDVWSRPGLDGRTRQLAAVAAFAATGQLPFMKVHAGYALNIGVSEEELKEIIYMITVPAGISRAIAASQVLSELFAERRNAEEATMKAIRLLTLALAASTSLHQLTTERSCRDDRPIPMSACG